MHSAHPRVVALDLFQITQGRELARYLGGSLLRHTHQPGKLGHRTIRADQMLDHVAMRQSNALVTCRVQAFEHDLVHSLTCEKRELAEVQPGEFEARCWLLTSRF